MATLMATTICPSLGTELEATLETHPKEVNLMIFFDRKYYQQALDSRKNSSWNLRHINYITEIKNILDEFSIINNIYLVHHGNRYCKEGSDTNPKLFYQYAQ